MQSKFVNDMKLINYLKIYIKYFMFATLYFKNVF